MKILLFQTVFESTSPLNCMSNTCTRIVCTCCCFIVNNLYMGSTAERLKVARKTTIMYFFPSSYIICLDKIGFYKSSNSMLRLVECDTLVWMIFSIGDINGVVKFTWQFANWLSIWRIENHGTNDKHHRNK